MAKINYLALNDTLRPINKNTVKSIERNSAKYIYVNRDRVAKCERCESEFSLPNVKHRASAKCPKCKRTLEVIHTWRKSGNESVHWEIVGSAATDTTFVLRYYKVERIDGKIIDSDECARMYINTDKKEICKVENNFWTGEWEKNGYHYFREFGMGYVRNRLFCMDGRVRRNAILKELKKMPTLKYLDIENLWTSNYFAHALSFIIPGASLYEKLQKVGLSALVTADMENYIDTDAISFNPRKSKLTEMLGINKASLNYLKTEPTLKALTILQSMPTISEREFEALKGFSISDIARMRTLAKSIGCTVFKVANYITKQKSTAYEMSWYHDLLKKLDYDLKDKSYSMPKDLSKEYARVSEEYNRVLELERERERRERAIRMEKEEKERAEFEAKKAELLKAVHENITTNPLLKEFFNGTRGFMVHVPMSEEEFIAEGRAQHNCVGSMGYSNRMAKNETIVVFVRKLDDPKAPFITMEYRNGRIIQCMLDHNVTVKHDTEVYDFCTEFAKRLNDCKILSA